VAVGRGMDGEELLARADRAMYRAKAGGGGRYAAHDPGLLRRRVTA